jgi:cytochrome c oxidase cbb3-type subunit III
MRSLSTARVWINVVGALALAAIGVAAQPPPAGGAQPGGRGAPAQTAANPCGPTTPTRGGGMLAGAGPADKPPVDPAAADRAKPLYTAECLTCHGTMARGTAKGSNLIRSLAVLRDRCGSVLGPFLKGKHTAQSPAAANLTAAQVFDLAHYLRQRVNDSLRGSPLFVSQNVLTGDPEAGLAYFEGEGKCTTCHSIKGDLAGIGKRLEPIDLQQRMLFPGAGRGGRRGAPGGAAAGAPSRAAVTVTVTPPGEPAVSGVLVQLDDFTVALRDGSGTYRSFKRTPGLQIAKNDPLAFHQGLLDRLSDKNMHDLVAYLEKVK